MVKSTTAVYALASALLRPPGVWLRKQPNEQDYKPHAAMKSNSAKPAAPLCISMGISNISAGRIFCARQDSKCALTERFTACTATMKKSSCPTRKGRQPERRPKTTAVKNWRQEPASTAETCSRSNCLSKAKMTMNIC